MTSDTEIFGTSNKICTTVVLNLQNRALIDVKCNRSLQQRTYRNANGTHDRLIAMAWLFKRPIYQSQRSSANIVVPYWTTQTFRNLQRHFQRKITRIQEADNSLYWTVSCETEQWYQKTHPSLQFQPRLLLLLYIFIDWRKMCLLRCV